MRAPIQSSSGQLFALTPFLFITVLSFIIVMNNSAKSINSTKNISGWTTSINYTERFIRIQETKPEKIQYSPRFGPVNTPPYSSIHDLQIEKEHQWIKVGDHVSVQVNCVGRDTMFNISNVCTIENITILD